MVDLSHIQMPDVAKMILLGYDPKDLLSVPQQKMYLELPEFCAGQFQKLGTGQVVPPPAVKTPSTAGLNAPAGLQGDILTEYRNLIVQLQQSFTDLETADTAIPPLAKDMADISEQAKVAINDAIDILNQNAATPPSGMIEDEWVMSYVTTATGSIAEAIQQATKKIQAALDQNPPTVPPVKPLGDGTEAGVKPFASTPAPTAPAPTPAPPSPTPVPPLTPVPTTKDASVASVGAVNDQVAQAIDDLAKTAAGANGSAPVQPVTPQTPSDVATPNVANGEGGLNGMGGMGGFGSGIDPNMLMESALMNRPMNDQYPNDQFGDLNRDQYDRYPQNVMPVQPTPPAAVTPQNPAAAPAVAQPAVPGDRPATSDQPHNQPGGRVPDANGLVTYTFYDKKVQQVSVLVAQALDSAFGPNATNGQQSYENTTAKWSDSTKIGTQVGTNDLVTGGIAVWQNPDRTAVVRAMGSGADGTLEAIVKGKFATLAADDSGNVVPSASELSGDAGTFGDFAGYFHPNGVAQPATTTAAAPASGMPVTSDPAAAATPAVTVPTI
ncbi:hypothetical protein [Nocardia tengchongensis]|uniref:hypothetical protein n=1 Tax=Nocardia tengchongensis TaxID=2055889 RepID=UPI00369CCB3F